MNVTPFSAVKAANQQFRTIPVIGECFADAVTPIHIVQQLGDEVAFILESKDDESPWARFSFIGLNPFVELIEQNGVYQSISRSGSILVETEDFKSCLQQTIDVLDVQPLERELPFYGGAVGYMAYDAIETIEKTLANARESEAPLYHFLFCETLIVYDHTEKKLAVIYLSTEDGGSLDTRYKCAVNTIETVVETIHKRRDGDRLLRPAPVQDEVSFQEVSSNYEKEVFLRDVERIKEYIRAGDVFQAVLSQRFERELSVRALDVYRVLRMINPSPYLFYIKFHDVEVVGSSPERLVQVQDGHVEIHPIAGTRKRGATREEDEALAKELLADEKERAEHYMLVDLARNDIGRIAEYGTVKTPTLLEIGKFSHVMHIISKVTGELKQTLHPLDALRYGFPAGTVSGAPKIRAMEILNELEPTKRGIYAGAIAYLGFDGNIDSCIAIRTMIVKDGRAYIQAGAGIVADSVPENEYEETRNKAKALLKAVEMAEAMFAKKEATPRV
ncbi:anthranilate synthase component I [Halalkalibacterium halodurans]|uniref:Anthranilate synthase component 1 n=1 Tax=Halalkalibacterium halodurans (strain ATCC BAA-125 / DSM 18197 / FERM 7344 / JCM 9153 / C-125) TaxID=272558 RepID=Q9KCB4_HALH5|nr:anthranilate synthase component I [Halalkalibacterium halodurans]MED4081364.1 anthranilate synthase component I [Halalkalibacterium halodurans]MED4086903.1 anthranilate synthase component I [Halalkalibacterium halodurans]MED4104322.1 anthranilate synthase component I [Halalkalibacterium halodurans]MED4109215.1 anthranilate synthase component I [Halalkalibacterium halodurans]MED4150748.1 anthranilate synthase component I [Halalkalibacterium halodurans]